MPTIIEYFGIFLKFFANDHEPIHVHAYYAEYAVKAEFEIKNKVITKIIYKPIKGKTPLPPKQMKDLDKLIKAKSKEIITAWMNFYVLNAPVKKIVITKKIK